MTGRPPLHIAVTGAAGFVGQACAIRLAADGHRLTLIGNSKVPKSPGSSNHRALAIGPIEEAQNLAALLRDADLVVHCAGLPAAPKGEPDPTAALEAANVRAVARLCAAMPPGPDRQLILVSSIFARTPVDDYGVSKRNGEEAARVWADQHKTALVILRPSLVYGPGAGGNIKKLAGLIDRGVPLPFANVQNRRSLCSINGLIDAVACCAAAAPRQGTYEICDDEVMSVPEIVRCLAAGMGRAPRLFGLPPIILRQALSLGSGKLPASLLGDLILDNSALKRTTGWVPPFSTDVGLRNFGASFKP